MNDGGLQWWAELGQHETEEAMKRLNDDFDDFERMVENAEFLIDSMREEDLMGDEE